MELKDKIIILTGAAGGIGQALACKFFEEGARIVVADKNEERVKRLAKDIDGLGVYCDVTKENEINIKLSSNRVDIVNRNSIEITIDGQTDNIEGCIVSN